MHHFQLMSRHFQSSRFQAHCNNRTHHCLTLPEHSKRKQTGKTSEKQELIFWPFEVSLYHRMKRQVNGKNYCLKYGTEKRSYSIMSTAFFISKNRYSVNAVECNIFFYSLTSERLYSNASGYVLPSVVLSHLAERQKIKKIRSKKEG